MSEHDPNDITLDEMELIRRTVAAGATDENLKLYLFDCKRRGIHPLDKLLHFQQRNAKEGNEWVKKYVPVLSIDYMRIRAESSGCYAGSDEPAYSRDDKNMPVCAVTVWKIVGGVRCPFVGVAYWSEYAQRNKDGSLTSMWAKMPHNQLAKCAEAQALRKAFPGTVSGLYEEAEIPKFEQEAGEETDATQLVKAALGHEPARPTVEEAMGKPAPEREKAPVERVPEPGHSEGDFEQAMREDAQRRGEDVPPEELF